MRCDVVLFSFGGGGYDFSIEFNVALENVTQSRTKVLNNISVRSGSRFLFFASMAAARAIRMHCAILFVLILSRF